MFFLNSCDKISQFIDRKPEVFDNFVHGGSEGLVVRVHEDVVDATVLEQVLLKKQDPLRCFKDCARCFKDFTSYLGLFWSKGWVGLEYGLEDCLSGTKKTFGFHIDFVCYIYFLYIVFYNRWRNCCMLL